MDERQAWERLADARVATLATIAQGEPHQVPITFALVDRTIVSAVDRKPKTTLRLKRLENIERTGVASVLAHHYSEEWDALWWVRVDGPATVHSGFESLPGAAEALAAKYQQYAGDPPKGPAIAIEGETIRWWSADHG